MPHPILATRVSAFLVGLLVAVGMSNLAVAGPEQDQFEEKMVARGVERAIRIAKSDRGMWVKELEDAFPNKIGNPLKEEEYAAWFKLLAGEATEWRRDNSPNTRIAELFDRVIQKLELGPVPSVKRDEFMRYARKSLVPGNPQVGEGGSDPNDEPDKVFRALDRDADGKLEPEEMTTKLREERPTADADGNGRIDKEEYRAYFRHRVTANSEVATKAVDQLNRIAEGKPSDRAGAGGAALPTWFNTIDEDEDGQVSLAEWRKSGRDISTFMLMDLDGDGLLTKEEYARHAKMREKEEAANKPPPKKSGKH